MIAADLSRWTPWLVSVPPPDPLGPVQQDPDSVRDAACRLVESSEVCAPAPPATIVESAGASSGGGGLFGMLLWLLLIAAVLGVVYLGVRYFLERERSARRSGDDGPDDIDPHDDALIGTVSIDRARDPRDWRDEAAQHRAAGRIRDALRCRYRALVGDLARRGLLDEIPGRTTGEERGQLRASAPAAVSSFGEGADLFDAAWYGHVGVGPADDDRFQVIDRTVLANAAPLQHRVPRTDETALP